MDSEDVADWRDQIEDWRAEGVGSEAWLECLEGALENGEWAQFHTLLGELG